MLLPSTPACLLCPLPLDAAAAADFAEGDGAFRVSLRTKGWLEPLAFWA